MRTEQDMLGKKELPDDALYGINTQRAIENFALVGKKTDLSLIRAVILVKKAAALTYTELQAGKPGVYQAISDACDELLKLSDEHLTQFFPLSAFQGGAGTSTNMNVNEVLANLALLKLGKKVGDYQSIHPLDDINRGQSTNDVYPTALRIASIIKLRTLSAECAALQEELQKLEIKFGQIPKLGRTELMDAVPITLGDEFGSYAQAVSRDRWRLYKIEERLRQVNLGGTAVGLSDNASRKYRFRVIEILRELTDMGLASAEYPMDITQNNDVFVEVSGLLKALAVNLLKICTDLRLMNSGPYGGLGEIHLQAMQQGSTIMPGKINPVIPEMVMQCAMKTISDDTAITMASSRGEFELNAFVPLIADSLLEAFELLEGAVNLLRTKCLNTLTADVKTCKKHLEDSDAFGTAYTEALGYDEVSHILAQHEPKEARRILDERLRNL